MHKKTLLLAFLSVLLILPVIAQSDEFETAGGYRISQIEYDIEGITKTSAMERNVSFDKNKVFSSKEDFELYLERMAQAVENLRLLDDISVTYEITEVQEDVNLTKVKVSAKDSKHLLVLPKPGYNSNSGAELKLKLKDSNFLGHMNTLDSDLNLNYYDSKFTTGFGFNFDYPFSVGKLQNTWSNDFNISYTFGAGSPEFGYTTGLGVGVPLGNSNLNFTVSQSVTRELDYNYDDNSDVVYFTEAVGINYPVLITKFYDVVPFTWTPSVSYSFNWDFDGINSKNSNLYRPGLTVGETFGFNAVNWIGNYRKGYSASAGQSLTFSFDPELESDVIYIPKFTFDAKYYTTWGWGGFDSHFYGLWEQNTTTCIGGNLRGTRDAYTYTSSAILLQLELPIHLFTTDFKGFWMEKYGSYENFSWFAKAMSFFDCEVQANPFIDAALIKNEISGAYFNPKDGFYDAGLEVWVYPKRFKSFVVRMSGGVDIGKKFFSNYLNMEHRGSARNWEISFGLGHNF